MRWLRGWPPKMAKPSFGPQYLERITRHTTMIGAMYATRTRCSRAKTINTGRCGAGLLVNQARHSVATLGQALRSTRNRADYNVYTTIANLKDEATMAVQSQQRSSRCSRPFAGRSSVAHRQRRSEHGFESVAEVGDPEVICLQEAMLIVEHAGVRCGRSTARICQGWW